jgi:hypothetical protein
MVQESIKHSQSYSNLENLIKYELPQNNREINVQTFKVTQHINDILKLSIERRNKMIFVLFLLAIILCIANLTLMLHHDYDSLILFKTTFSYNKRCISIRSIASLDFYCIKNGNIDDVTTWLE